MEQRSRRKEPKRFSPQRHERHSEGRLKILCHYTLCLCASVVANSRRWPACAAGPGFAEARAATAWRRPAGYERGGKKKGGGALFVQPPPRSERPMPEGGRRGGADAAKQVFRGKAPRRRRDRGVRTAAARLPGCPKFGIQAFRTSRYYSPGRRRGRTPWN